MVSRLRSWWQKIKQHPMRSTFVGIACVLGIVLLIGGYFFNWTWTGFGPYSPPTGNFQREKTLYDWLQLAIIPVALAVGVWWLNRLQQQRDQKLADQRVESERKAAEKQAQTERDIASDNQSEQALQAYIDSMSELLLDRHLRELKPEYAEVQAIARVRTLTVLPRLDGKRKASVLQFLYESSLIDKGKTVVYLAGADLSEAHLFLKNLIEADLSGVNLEKALLVYINLRKADLSRAVLHGADLSKANLSEADLSFTDLSFAILLEADLSGTDLSEAYLLEAKYTDEQLKQAKSLKGATLRDGTKHH